MSEDKTSLKNVVASYLSKHPDFFNDNPDLLKTMELNHQSGAAVSLIERQVDQLRSSNEEMSRQLKRLIQVAAENEKLMSRLHGLTLELMMIGSIQAFFTHLGNSLLNDFNADILQICLFDQDTAELAGEDVMGISADDAAIEPFLPLLEKSQTVCGRLNESKLNFLFGTKARWVQSTVLIPLGKNGKHGMMAIGSSDPGRFYPGMGTLFLELLANVISATLADREPEEQRRSA
jgi:uncharacterized protein YigA (DUF484 family)